MIFLTGFGLENVLVGSKVILILGQSLSESILTNAKKKRGATIFYCIR